jgi:catechol 2,3-dioxygenase-like lactoylglutathione lyase family enzyme
VADVGFPGLRGSDHFGVTVPDIEQATAFLVGVLGGEVVFELGPVSHNDDFMATHMSIHPRSVIRKLRMIKVRNGPAVELFEYESPGQKSELPRNSDWGGHHIAFYVDDMDTAISHLRRHGVKVQGNPTILTTGPSAGLTWCYFLAPWGMQMELVSYPRGLAYEGGAGPKLWDPRT